MSVPWYLMAKGKGGGGYKTASGPIVSVSDALAAPIRSLVANIDPVQDLHGYDSPWPAGGGKNLLDWDKVSVSGTHYGMTFSKGAAEGTVTISGTLATSSGAVAPIVYADNTLSGKGYVFLTEHISGDSVIELSRTYGFRTESEKAIAVFLSGTMGQSYTETIRVSVYAPPAPASWSPYSNICPISGWDSVDIMHSGADTSDPTVYTITLGQTVYGGTLDVTNGVMTVDRAMADMGTLSWIYRSNLGGISATLNPIAKDRFHAICSAYPFGGAYSDMSDKQCGYVYNNQIFVKDTDYSDAAAFKAAMSGVQLVYELATPIIIPLTATQISTLAGQNVLWADSGDVTVEYLASGGTDPNLMKLAVAFMGRK